MLNATAPRQKNARWLLMLLGVCGWTGSPALAALLADGDNDCLYLERNVELAFVDMPLATELERTAWAYTPEYAKRFLMPEDYIEPLVGAMHSRYVVRQDVNLVCAVGGECWPMNHCQFELYVPRSAGVTGGRTPDSYQDPMWGDRIARFLSPRDAADVRYMNERRRHMRYDLMAYEVREGSRWRVLGSMQLIGYRKAISDELDALVVEGDCAWYRDGGTESGRIVLVEDRDGVPWRHAIELPGSYLARVANESARRLWPSVDAYEWWWADTWWPEEGFEIDYDDRFSEAGALARGEPYWLKDSHAWDYTREFAERFGMPKRPDFLTAEKDGLKGAYVMTGQIACKGLQDGVGGPYTTRHGFRSENLHTELDYVYYCEGGKNPIYEFYLPYEELKAMGAEALDIAEQMTWMPRDVYRGWRKGETPVELCRHPDFDQWLFGSKFFRRGVVSQFIDWWKGRNWQTAFSGESNLAMDLRLMPGIFSVVYAYGSVNLREHVTQWEVVTLLDIDDTLRQRDNQRWHEMRWEFLAKLEELWSESAVQEYGDQDEYLVFSFGRSFREKYFRALLAWEQQLERIGEIAASERNRSHH